MHGISSMCSWDNVQLANKSSRKGNQIIALLLKNEKRMIYDFILSLVVLFKHVQIAEMPQTRGHDQKIKDYKRRECTDKY